LFISRSPRYGHQASDSIGKVNARRLDQNACAAILVRSVLAVSAWNGKIAARYRESLSLQKSKVISLLERAKR
jgi:hypothetical protein